MKKILITLLIVLIALTTFSVAYATTMENSSDNEFVKIVEKEKNNIEDYNKAYGSEAYGFTAYILSKIRIYSIPFCFLGIVIGAIYQYVIGIRKLDVKNKGFQLIIVFVTLFVICQVLPLIFAIVVKSWRG